MNLLGITFAKDKSQYLETPPPAPKAKTTLPGLTTSSLSSKEPQEIEEQPAKKTLRILRKLGLCSGIIPDSEPSMVDIQAAVFFCMRDTVDQFINYPLGGIPTQLLGAKDFVAGDGMPRPTDWKRFCDDFEIPIESFINYLPLGRRHGAHYRKYLGEDQTTPPGERTIQ